MSNLRKSKMTPEKRRLARDLRLRMGGHIVRWMQNSKYLRQLDEEAKRNGLNWEFNFSVVDAAKPIRKGFVDLEFLVPAEEETAA
jgi:hypothetical protein